MPRNSSGVYTLPASNPVVPFTTIATSWANPTLSDIAGEITNSLDRNGRGGMLAPFRVFDGTISQPGLAFINETNLGFWRSAAGIMHLVAGNNNIITIEPTKATTYVLEHRDQDMYKLVGYVSFEVALGTTGTGEFLITPSATINAEDWDYTKSLKFGADGTLTVKNLVVTDASPGAYVLKTGDTMSGALNINSTLNVQLGAAFGGNISAPNVTATQVLYGMGLRIENTANANTVTEVLAGTFAGTQAILSVGGPLRFPGGSYANLDLHSRNGGLSAAIVMQTDDTISYGLRQLIYGPILYNEFSSMDANGSILTSNPPDSIRWSMVNGGGVMTPAMHISRDGVFYCASYMGVGQYPRAPLGQQFALDVRTVASASARFMLQASGGQGFRLVASDVGSYIDSGNYDANGALLATPAQPLYLRTTNPAGTTVIGLTIANTGDVIAEKSLKAASFITNVLDTSVPAGATNIDCAAAQTFAYGMSAGSGDFNLINFSSGSVIRLFVYNLSVASVVTWACAGASIFWPTSGGGVPPDGAEFNTGANKFCVFTFMRINVSVVMASYQIY
jgi:hypothetical protein